MWRLLIVVVVLLFTSVANAQSNTPLPEGYVLQPLQPTGGQIAKPKDWFYRYQPTRSGWIWVVSAEDPAGKFETGWQTQALVGVERTTHHPTKDFALHFLEEKRKSGRVLRECPTTDDGLLMKTCIESVEGPQRFIYSVFWGKDNLDMVFITTFGAPQANWDRVSTIANTLDGAQLITPEFADHIKKSNRQR